MERKFYEQLHAKIEKKKKNHFWMVKCISHLFKRYSKWGERKKEPRVYQFLKHYNVVQIGNTVKLIYPVAERNFSIKYYVRKEDIFWYDTWCLSCNRSWLMKSNDKGNTKYENITPESIMLYLSLCVPCLKISKVPKKGLAIKPIFSETNSRAHVDLTDMQIQPDGDLKWILVYQDHVTKFVQLCPVKSKRAPEIAYQLLDIFSKFGTPSILQSDNGREFVNSVITELSETWVGLKLVHGKPRHSQSKWSVQLANRDMEDMLNSTTHWDNGLRFDQAMKNRADKQYSVNQWELDWKHQTFLICNWRHIHWRGVGESSFWGAWR